MRTGWTGFPPTKYCDRPGTFFSDVTRLGSSDVWIQLCYVDYVLAGLYQSHMDELEPSQWCSGFVAFRASWLAPEGSRHTLTSEEPLSVNPSVLCQRCGCHGRITEGEWVTK